MTTTTPTQYSHRAGQITLVNAVDLRGETGQRLQLHLYRVGDALHRLSPNGDPLGEVAISDCTTPILGWGINNPILIDGIVADADQIQSIGR